MNSQTKTEVAQSASGIGAFILGLGVASFFPSFFLPAKYFLAIAGLLLHGWGMIRLAGMKDSNGRTIFYTNHWIKLSFWVCTIGLIVLLIYMIY